MADLPFANGRQFADLDSYLSFRAELGTMDRPYFEFVGPDRYQLIQGRATATRPPQYFTRAQLLEKFGFTE